MVYHLLWLGRNADLLLIFTQQEAALSGSYKVNMCSFLCCWSLIFTVPEHAEDYDMLHLLGCLNIRVIRNGSRWAPIKFCLSNASLPRGRHWPATTSVQY